jgi:Holliday junction resolvase RusA-like endonuclease
MTEYNMVLIGHIPAKKNLKTPVRNKEGKVRFYNPGQADIDRLALQVPAELRDLRLRHADFEFWFQVPDGRRDRDNSVTTLFDIFVQMGVIWNDSIARSNGKITIHPATLGDVAKTIIKITDTGRDLWPTK